MRFVILIFLAVVISICFMSCNESANESDLKIVKTYTYATKGWATIMGFALFCKSTLQNDPYLEQQVTEKDRDECDTAYKTIAGEIDPSIDVPGVDKSVKQAKEIHRFAIEYSKNYKNFYPGEGYETLDGRFESLSHEKKNQLLEDCRKHCRTDWTLSARIQLD